MHDVSLASFSNHLADLVESAAPSVVQVLGRRRLASGVVFGGDAVVTMAQALGGEDGLRVRTHDGREREAELRGWDPATNLVVLRIADLGAPIAAAAEAPARVGHIILAIGRSWSGAVTATSGIVSIIGGPLPTGRGHSIDRVLRTTAAMHSGYVGGPVLDVSGRVVGIAAPAEIRGLRVVIPSDIAWKVAASLAAHGTPQRGYLGVAGQSVRIPTKGAGGERPAQGVLVMNVSEGSPAETAGVLVGDVITSLDGNAVSAPVDLLHVLEGDRVGHDVAIDVLRGGVPATLRVTIGQRAGE